MNNSIASTPVETLPRAESAERNISTSTGKLKLAILWLVVGLPLLWGVMKALEEAGNLTF
jgi:hypothetical protein